MPKRDFDLIVFGASSFVGQILVATLVSEFNGGREALRWAMAGRSRSKLEAVRAALPQAGHDTPILLADAADEAALRKLCGQTRVVVSTVGPYALHGEALVKACADTGTDYCDLTGEVQWVRRMQSQYQAAAHASGARIVHCCGFDSIPSDLGVWFLQQAARERFGAPLSQVKMRVARIKGTASGGTVASMVNIAREAAKSRALRRELADPYSLCPEGHGVTVRQPQVRSAVLDRDFGAWCAPFVMAAINTRVVHRSNALLDYAYGRDFRYDEAMLTGSGVRGRLRAAAVTAGIAGFVVGAAIRPSRWLLEHFVLPKPGEGPSPATQAAGRFDLRFVGSGANGETLRARVTGDRDPGYGSTARMLAQAAASLALDHHGKRRRIGRPGGFWTPATMFGERLIERLTARAGITFSLDG
jgi:short subunit dehydrogenase-like uncharacterized protein